MSPLHPRLILLNTNESEHDHFRVLCGNNQEKGL